MPLIGLNPLRQRLCCVQTYVRKGLVIQYEPDTLGLLRVARSTTRPALNRAIPPGPQKWVPSDRWFHRSHLNAATTGGAGVGRVCCLRTPKLQRRGLRIANPKGGMGGNMATVNC